MSKRKTVTIIVENVDLRLLKDQRVWLQRLKVSNPIIHMIPELQGLIALTDAMADYAADTLKDKRGLML